MNSFFQFLTFGKKYGQSTCHKDNYELSIVLSGLQVSLQVVIVFIILSIFSKTFLFRQGMCGILCKRFFVVFIFLFLYPFCCIVQSAIFAEKIRKNPNNKGVLEIWEETKYWYCILLLVLKYIFAFVFYLGGLKIVFELGNSSYYKVNYDLVDTYYFDN